MTKEKIYQAFFYNEEKLYYNQLKEITKLSYSSLQNTLKKLLENKEITKEKTKAHTFYQLTTKFKSIEFSKITINLINNLNLDVKTTIKELADKLPKTIHTAILYGSASRKEEKEDSDIDLLIILENFNDPQLQEKYEEEMKNKIQAIQSDIVSKYEISTAYTIKKTFKEQKDHLLKEAKQTGFPIINQQKYYEDENNRIFP